MFTAVALSFSVFALISVQKYEHIRIRSKDNQDELAALTKRIESVRQLHYKGNKSNDLVTQLLMQQFGLNAENDYIGEEQDEE
ncbi:MAG: hypothetical protein OXI24_16135 [Candidatus Poribacteria bacterium]|nr:hypothetical protein [Candidatus Poribacteria bacterium]